MAPPASAVLCSDRALVPDAWYVDATFYEVFVRSFQDSDGDGIGDFDGLTSRLDYLNDGDPRTTDDLGVTALWLMPINPSPSYHGYDVTNYRDIAKDYGGMEAFDRFLEAAHARGIRVVMDLVVNHTSTQHPWFVRGKRGPDQPTWDHYIWSDTKLDWGQPWNEGATTWHAIGPRFFYGLFWDGMPDLNYRSPEVSRKMLEIATFWLDRGVDGFRLDAARYLVENGRGKQADQPETHAFWRALRRAAHQSSSDKVLIGEVWTDLDTTVSYFGDNDELHMLFGFDRAGALRAAATDGRADGLKRALCSELKMRPDHAWLGSFATNHDMNRLATRLGNSATPQRLALVADLLMTLPGTPFVYYGQELGMKNGPGKGDPEKRMPMRWDRGSLAGFSTSESAWTTDDRNDDLPPVAIQSADPTSLWSAYRAAIARRAMEPALRRGHTWVLKTKSDGEAFAFLRAWGEHVVLVAANVGSTEAVMELPLKALGWAASSWGRLGGPIDAPQRSIRLPAATVSVWRLQGN